MKYSQIAIITVTTILSAEQMASADTVGSRRNQRGVPTAIGKGVFQLGADSTLVTSFISENGTSSYRANLVGAVALRYFVKRNVGASLRIGGIFRKNGDANDAAGTGSVWGNYYMRLGEGIFLTPGVGVGMLYGERDVQTAAGIARATLVGGTLSVEFPLTFFTSKKFSLKAGPEFTLTAGASTPEAGGESTGVTSIDGSFKIGFDYSY